MLQLTTITQNAVNAPANVTLPFEQRCKSRLRVILDDGREAAIMLPRGTILRNGDLLSDGNRIAVRVKAAAESVSTVYSDNSNALARACYHLGNRHVALMITADFIRYQHDHVLDDMVRGLGLNVKHEEAVFEPEAGAYQEQGHHHGHEH